VFSVGLNTPGGTSGNYTAQIYDNTNYYTSVYGAIASQWGIEGVNFNTTTGQYYITIAHRVSTGNGLRIKVKAYGFSSDYLASDRFGGLSAGSVYTTDTTAFDAAVIEMDQLGIGTASPEGNLEIWESTADTAASLRLTGDPDAGANTEYANIIFHSRDSSTGANGGEAQIRAYRGGDRDAPYLNFDLANTVGVLQQIMTIHGQNNAVGIGTTAPSYKLDVNAGLSAGGGIAYPIRAGHGSMGNAGDGVGILFSRGSAEQYFGYVRIQSTVSNPSFLDPRLEFGIQDTGTYNLADASTRMVITGSGNVGIGTISPSDKLHVVQNIDLNTALFQNTSGRAQVIIDSQTTAHNSYLTLSNGGSEFAFLDAKTSVNLLRIATNNTGAEIAIETNSQDEAVRIDSNGNVGIGTASPAYELEVSTASNSRITASNTGYSVVNHLQADNTGGWVGTLSNHPLIIKTNNTEKVRVTTAGNVGIGTNNPTEKLEIVRKCKTNAVFWRCENKINRLE
jgi:hypothetical protein